MTLSPSVYENIHHLINILCAIKQNRFADNQNTKPAPVRYEKNPST